MRNLEVTKVLVTTHRWAVRASSTSGATHRAITEAIELARIEANAQGIDITTDAWLHAFIRNGKIVFEFTTDSGSSIIDYE